MHKYLSFAAVLFLVVLMQLSGCAGPGYYSQAISGHLGLMRKRQDLPTAIESANLSDEQIRQLEKALEIRRFASSELGLPDNGSYTRFVNTGQDAVTWNVVAAGEFSVQPETWCFPVAGCVPYRGYFKQDKAEKFNRKLADKGLDTDLSPAIAYSTLGWFDDPLLDTMLQYDEEQLAGIIFHELAHQQLYVKNDTAFNEAYANFIEQSGVQFWLMTQDRLDRQSAWQAAENASLLFNRLLLDARSDLQVIYNGPAPEELMRQQKSERFEQLRSEYRSLVENKWGGRDYYRNWFSRELNNARLALMSSYEGGSCAFESLFQQAGGEFETFHELARQKSRLADGPRSEWMETACEVIAPDDNL